MVVTIFISLCAYFAVYVCAYAYISYVGDKRKNKYKTLLDVVLSVSSIIAFSGGLIALFFDKASLGNILIILSGIVNVVTLIVITGYSICFLIVKRKMCFENYARILFAIPIWYFPFVINFIVK